MRKAYIFLLIVAVFLAGCTSLTENKEQLPEEKETPPPNVAQFNSSLVAKADESVYYVVSGSVSNDSVISIRYLSPFEGLIGSRPWSVGQKCISWDASYDWMSANVKTSKYTVKLTANEETTISIIDTFITKDKGAFEDYKAANC